jgi:uncharacterized protein (DUF2336 family)
LTGVDRAQQILILAKSKDPADRERLMLSLATLCEAAQGGQTLEPAVQVLVDQVFSSLIDQAERDIRRALAERLATAAWAPRDLVKKLASDEIEIARPIIAQSPVVDDAMLAQLLAETDIEHQIEVARRPGIGASVVEIILSQGQPAVLTALADNDTADISHDGMAKLVEASREIAAMRSPLVRHPRLTTQLAEQLYAWVGQSLRAAIVARYRVDPEALDRALAQAVTNAQSIGRLRPIILAGEGERREMELQLVAKLNAAHQLKPGYLIRALREQRLSLFVAALAELAGVSATDIDRAIRGSRPELLALACTAAGVDRSAFATILALVRRRRPARRPRRLQRPRDAGLRGAGPSNGRRGVPPGPHRGLTII